MKLTVDKKLDAIIRHIVKTDLGDLLAEEVKKQFEPIAVQIDLIRKENRDSYDNISTQITEDRKDINQLKEDSARGIKQNEIIIDNQNHQEEAVVEAVEKATEDIKPTVEKSVDRIFEKKGVMQKMIDKITQ
jgi:hypothetical protein